MKTKILVALFWFCSAVISPTIGPLIMAAEQEPVFESDIQPILALKCGKCHGKKVRKSGLDLLSMRGILRGGESDESIVADSTEESHLWTMIDGGHMPPKGQSPLTKDQVDTIRRWIVAGTPSRERLDPKEKLLTQHDVLPILLLRCTTCHGPRLQEGRLDLRTPAAMLRGGKSGPAIVPGDPNKSLLIQRIESEACPPRELLLKFFVKRPPNAEIEIVRDWIAAGAPDRDVLPDVATTEPDPLVSDDDRMHWAFRPLSSTIRAGSIDEFIARKLIENNLAFAEEADRDTLIRRAYLDLIGLPPTLAEFERWREMTSSTWYEELIDQLLASPHYGERWGRYWLDLAGYADSEGGVSSDPVRPVAWKYRDYVIEAFNADTSYDRFLLQQLAGDELIDAEDGSPVSDEIVNNLVATGFLRMGIDQTGSRTMNFVPERIGVISDAINVVGSGVMGLTLECARCHSHKYDPVPHRDYYRFKAIFQGAYDEHDWLNFKTRTLQVATSEHRNRVSKINPPLRKQIKKLESQLRSAVTAVRLELLRGHYPDQSEQLHQKTLAALRIADNNRTLPQRKLVEKLQKAEVIPQLDQPGSVLNAQKVVSDIELRIQQLRQQLAPEIAIRSLWDRGDPSPTYVLRRGEYDKPGQLVGPGVPSVLTDGQTPFRYEPPFPDGTPKTGRRLALARWLTRPDHPLTARVMVNRVWYHHFGAGLVRTLENFGVNGDRPSHPELLDWLSVEFVKRDWSLKELHRMVMNSRTYRQSSRISQDMLKVDPQNRLVSRMMLRRMDAETIRDSLLFVSGALDETSGGPPDPVTVNREGLVSVNPTTQGRWRRSVYAQYRRTQIPTMMETFDYPEMGPNCLTRTVSTVAPQSLMLMNNSHVRRLAASFARRSKAMLESSAAEDHGAQVNLVYNTALSRSPTAVERQLGIDTLRELTTNQLLSADEALEIYCHTILNSAAFLYID